MKNLVLRTSATLILISGLTANAFIPSRYSCAIPPQEGMKLALHIGQTRLGLAGTISDLETNQEIRSFQVLMREVPGGTLVYEGHETVGTYGATRKGFFFATPKAGLTKPGKVVGVLSVNPTHRLPEIGPVFLDCSVR